MRGLAFILTLIGCGAVQHEVPPDARAVLQAAAVVACVELHPLVVDHLAARLAWALACGALVPVGHPTDPISEG